MDFKEYLEVFEAQKKIDKLAKRYKKRKIVVYGAGQFSHIIFQNYDLSKLNIVAVCDKKFKDKKQREFFNYKCIPPEELGDYDCDLILVANFDYAKFICVIDYDVLLWTKNASVEIRPLIRLDFFDLFIKRV